MRLILYYAALTAFATSTFGNQWGPPPASPASNGKICTVLALGGQQDDTPQILQAFEDCNYGGTVVFPQTQNYWIGTKLNPILFDVTVEWNGVWTVRLFSSTQDILQ
jgi:galacturan 1,4-alpha-galacturonidase